MNSGKEIHDKMAKMTGEGPAWRSFAFLHGLVRQDGPEGCLTMIRLLVREAVLVALTGLIVRYLLPRLLGIPAAPAFLAVGFMFALTIMSLYAMTVLAGNRLPPRYKGALGAAALPLVALPGAPWGAGVPGLLLPALAALLRPHPGQSRADAAMEALYAYAIPMAAVRWLLVPLVGENPGLAAIGLNAGVAYLAMRGLVRIAWPLSAEGNREGAPLIHRPVPDWVVGLVERASGLHALPFALRADGSRDQSGISLRCDRAEAEDLLKRVRRAIADTPFQAEPGPEAGAQAQIQIHIRSGKS